MYWHFTEHSDDGPPPALADRRALCTVEISASDEVVRPATRRYARRMGWREITVAERAPDTASFRWGYWPMSHFVPDLGVTMRGRAARTEVELVATASEVPPSLSDPLFGHRRLFRYAEADGVAEVFARGLCRSLAAEGLTVTPQSFFDRPRPLGLLSALAQFCRFANVLVVLAFVMLLIGAGFREPAVIIVAFWFAAVGIGMPDFFTGILDGRLGSATVYLAFPLVLAAVATGVAVALTVG